MVRFVGRERELEELDAVLASDEAGFLLVYLERFDDGKSVGANIQRLFVRRTDMFRSEPFLLIGDVIRRETQTYEALLKVVASGLHTPAEIGKALEQTPSYLSPYLKQLETLELLGHS